MYRTSFVLLATALTLPAAASAQRYAPILMLDSTYSASANLATDVEDADVKVVTGPAGQIHVRIYASAESESEARDYFNREHFRVSVEGGGVRVGDHPERRNFRSGNRGAGLEIEITVPAHVDLVVRTSDGDIKVGDVTGRIELRSSDGDLTLGRLAGSRISIATSDGDIDAESLDAPNMDLRTSDGDVTLRAVSGDLQAKSSDGDVKVTLVKPGDVTLETQDGDVSVTIPRDTGFDVSLSGEDVDLDDVRIQVSGRLSANRVNGKIGAGGHRLTVRTSDGDVTLRAR